MSRYWGLPSPLCRPYVGYTIPGTGGKILDPHGSVLVSSQMAGGGWTTAHNSPEREVEDVLLSMGVPTVCEASGLFAGACSPAAAAYLATNRRARQGLIPDFLLLDDPRRLCDVKLIHLHWYVAVFSRRANILLGDHQCSLSRRGAATPLQRCTAAAPLSCSSVQGRDAATRRCSSVSLLQLCVAAWMHRVWINRCTLHWA